MNTFKKSPGIAGIIIALIIIFLSTACAPNIQELKNSKDVDGLITALNHKDPEIREEAAIALGEVGGSSALDPLGAAANDPDRTVRLAAVKALGEIGGPQVIDHLVDALDHKPPAPAKARDILIQIGSPAVPSLIRALNVGSQNQIEYTIEALSTIGDPRAVNDLIKLLDADNQEISIAAMRALAEIDDTSAVEPLIEQLTKGSTEQRLNAIRALGALGDNRAVGPLWENLSREIVPTGRLDIISALEQIGGIRSLTTLRKIASLDKNFGSRTQAAAEDSLKRLEEMEPDWRESEAANEAVPGLIQDLSNPNPYTRQVAAWALGELRSPAATGPLLTALEDKSPRVQSAAAWALGEIGDKQATQPLIDVLDDNRKRNHLGYTVIQALGKIGGEKASEALIEIVLTESHKQRLTAAHALGADKLTPLLEDEDTYHIYSILISMGISGTEEALSAALMDFGDKEMAQEYLNCGNPQLEKAAEEWASDHGYTVMPSIGSSSGPRWGD